jgi:hypothetical protein
MSIEIQPCFDPEGALGKGRQRILITGDDVIDSGVHQTDEAEMAWRNEFPNDTQDSLQIWLETTSQ